MEGKIKNKPPNASQNYRNPNPWNIQIKIIYAWLEQIGGNVKNVKTISQGQRENDTDIRIAKHIEQTQPYRNIGDLLSALKEFGGLPRKPYVAISELKEDNNPNIADPDASMGGE